MGTVNPRLAAIADRQAGIVMRAQARQAGYTDFDIDARLRRRAWVAVRRGAYVERELFERMSAVERHRARVHAVVRSLTVPALVSHTSAAVMHGLPTWGIDLSDVHVSRADLHSSRREAGVSHHSGEIFPEDVETVGGLKVTSLTRTMIDTARLTPFEAAVCVADAVLHRTGTAKQAALHRLNAMRDWPGSRNAGAVVAFADGRSESVGESRSRVLFHRVGLPAPELQYEIRTVSGLFVARCDFGWEEYGTVGEFDGKEKYERYLKPGESPGDVVWREKRREDAIRRLGYEVERLIWMDLDRADAVARRMRAALGRGTRLPRSA